MKNKPYLGVSGLSNIDETNQVIETFNKNGFNLDSDHIPFLGYLVSDKTLNNEILNPKYPELRDLRRLFNESRDKTINVIHYHTNETQNLFEQIEELFYGSYNDNVCNHLQLNVVWPDPKLIRKIKERFEDLKIIFQASPKVLQMDYDELISKFKDYDENIEYLLIDPSMGRGIDIKIEDHLEIYQSLKSQFKHLTIGFAGGFNGENLLDKIKILADENLLNQISIDAEDSLRENNKLNLEKVEDYIKKASLILN